MGAESWGSRKLCVANHTLRNTNATVAGGLSDAVVRIGMHDDGTTNGAAVGGKQGEGELGSQVVGYINSEHGNSVRIGNDVAQITSVPRTVADKTMHLPCKGKVHSGKQRLLDIASVAPKVHVNTVGPAALES